MKQLFVIDRHYWPDTNPLSVMLPKICGWLEDTDCEVTVISAQPGYKPEQKFERLPLLERENGRTIIRLILLPSSWGHGVRYVNYFLFLFCSVWIFLFLNLRHMGKRRYCMTATMPPVVQPFFLSLLCKLMRCRFIYNIQDIHPEILQNRLRWFHALLKNLDKIAINLAWRVIALSEDMLATLELRGCKTDHVRIINNFPLDLADEPGPESEEKTRDAAGTRFIFAGNLGRYQMLPELVTYFCQNQNNRHLTILGSGPLKTELHTIASNHSAGNVTFLDFVPAKEVPEILRSHDFGIATLQPDLIRYAFPSKILTYWNAGLPVLTTVDAGSKLARRLTDESLGANAEVDDLAEAIEELVSNRDQYILGVLNYLSSHHIEHWRERWLAFGREM